MSQTVIRPGKSLRTKTGFPTGLYSKLYRTQVKDRIDLIVKGVSAADAKLWLDLPALGRNITLQALDLSVATFNKKVKANTNLSPAESERVVGFARLVGQVEAMIEDTDGPSDFDARAWLARWLTEPLPALDNAKPIDFMNTMEGQSLVSQKLAEMSSGAYA